MMRSITLALAVAAAAHPAGAQQVPDSTEHDFVMRDAIRLATEGRADSARALVNARIRGMSPFDTGYPQMLYTAGLVASSAEDATRFFRQVSIEHADSEWADEALLRLAQWAFADGDFEAVKRNAERVLLDYPFSDVRAEAAFWVGRAEIDLGEPITGCRYLARAREEAGANVKLTNQASFYLLRCANLLGVDPQPDTARADTAQQTPAPGPAGTVVYTVQVAAVSSAAAADDAMRRLRDVGHTARVFRDADGLFKVRVGQFATRQDAIELAAQLRRSFGGEPFVTEEHRP